MNEETAKRFFEALDALPSGDRVALKRAAGTMLEQANGRAIRVFYQCLPYSVARWQESRWFAAGCLHCLWDANTKGRVRLVQALYQLGSEAAISESVGHRLESLLDLSWERDGYMLTKLWRMIKLVQSKGIAIDCEDLLGDLIDWNADSQNVQRKWARGLYGKLEAEEAEKKGE